MKTPSHTYPAVQFRFARPTDKIEKIVEFYTRGLQLRVLSEFRDHAGYRGVMIGLPDSTYHLEFTQDDRLTPCPAPTKDNLLVLYFASVEEYNRIHSCLLTLGCEPVEPENPYWSGKSLTFEDPDGWRIVLFNGVYAP